MVANNVISNVLTTGEAAHLLGLHINTVRRWSNNGTLKSQRVGPRRDRIFSREDVISLLYRQEDEANRSGKTEAAI